MPYRVWQFDTEDEARRFVAASGISHYEGVDSEGYHAVVGPHPPEAVIAICRSAGIALESESPPKEP